MLLTILITTIVVLAAVQADQSKAFIENAGYENSQFGPYPNQTFMTNSGVTAPVFNIIQPAADGVAQADYLFLGPKGDDVGRAWPTIVNATDLSLVWSGAGNLGANALDVRVQSYKGKDYVTFYSGSESGSGFGGGLYYMLDDSYNIAYNLSAQNTSVLGDFHEFQLTDNGSALITIYEQRPFDLSSITGGSKDGWILDSLFQELDVETGKLLFQWRSTDFFPVNATYNPLGVTGSEKAPFDWFHINSIEKDQYGNFLVSSRHLHTVTYLNGSTGDILWILGGKLNQFKDLSGGDATNFAWQHNARWTNDTLTGLTLFDNAATGFNVTESQTRGIRMSIDQGNKTVRLEQNFLNPQKISSESQGNVQLLPNDNVLMGYGSNPAMTEYSANGTVLWNIQFGLYANTTVQTYRAYKMNWTATPTAKPALAQTIPLQPNVSRNLFVSWNGATEVRGWAVLGSNSTSQLNNRTQLLFNVTKSGFETQFTLNATYQYIRCAALSSNGTVIGATDTLNVLSNDAVSTNTTIDLKPPVVRRPATTSSNSGGASSTGAAPASSSSHGSAERTIELPWKQTWAMSMMLGAVGFGMFVLA